MKSPLRIRLVLLAVALVGQWSRLEAARALGIDVSRWQGTITWASVPSSGITFAYAKATEGSGYQDPNSIANLSGGKAAGLYIGAYHYARYDLNTGTAGAIAEANYFWSVARPYITGDGRSLMPMLDVEASTAGYTPAALAQWINQWCNTVITNAAAAGLIGVKPVIYVSACHANCFDNTVAQWTPWIANYNGQDPQTGTPWSVCSGYNMWGTWKLWQYTSSGSVAGITGNVDRNAYNGTIENLATNLVVVADTDGDGISDSWEQTWFAGLGQPAEGDYDLDGASNVAEYLAGTNPTDGPPIITVAIAKSVDDAEESASGAMGLTSTDLELVRDDGTSAGLQLVGLRFHLNVPPGAIITSASIQFTADETSSEPTDLDIRAEAADYAARFDSNRLSSRALSTLGIRWQPAPWLTAGEAGTAQRTPDLTPLVQAIVSRPGWVRDNALAFVIQGTGVRIAQSFDLSGGTPPQLAVTYKMPAPLLTASASIATSTQDAEQGADGTVSLTSSDLELIRDEGTGAGDQTIGLRFEKLPIPAGAKIVSATIQFTADETNAEPTALTIRCHRSGNATALGTNANNLTSRPVTLGSVSWTPPPWNVVGERAAVQRTPDLSALVAEVVARPSWNQGNPLVFLVSGSGKRVAEAFDKSGGTPATLTVSYYAQPIVGSYAATLAAAGVSNTNGPAAAPEADLDGDGWNNQVEHALGQHPAQPGAPAFSFAHQGATISFTYVRPRVISDVSYAVEWRESLTAGVWSRAGVTELVIADDGTNQTVQATLPSGSASQRFVRLKIAAQ